MISGNAGSGVLVEGTTAANNTIQENLIGTDGSGLSPLGNVGDGIKVFNSPGTRVYANVIGGNGGTACAEGADGLLVKSNTIGTNLASNGLILGNCWTASTSTAQRGHDRRFDHRVH